MLYIGEKVGSGEGPKIDIALDPLEGTTLTAKGLTNALAVIAMAEEGGFLYSPDVYMDKIAVGGALPVGVVDLDESPANNLTNLAKAKNLEVSDIVACILDRPRHEELIAKVREAGARIMLITDGDISGVIATSEEESGVDIYLGSGGAPEGVLAAAALQCIGGQMQGRLIFRNEDERKRATNCGITDFDRKYELSDLAHGEVMIAATGVTTGTMLKGVRRYSGGATTHSLVMRSKSGTVRYVEAFHNFERKTGFDPVYGARPLKRYLQHELETRIARAIVAGKIPDGSHVTVDHGDGELDIRIQTAENPLAAAVTG